MSKKPNRFRKKQYTHVKYQNQAQEYQIKKTDFKSWNKMREKQKLLIYSAIFYACSSANIYLAVRFLLAGEYLYPIFFWILFGLDKIITIIAAIQKCLPFLADFFQLGTIYLFFYDSPFDLDNISVVVFTFKVLPLLFTQSILYFCGNLLSNPLISNQDVILAYLLFLAYIIIAIVCVTEIPENDSSLKTNTLDFYTGFTLLSSVVLISKDFSFNFGYLHIIIIGIEAIALIIYLSDFRYCESITFHIFKELAFFFVFNVEKDNESILSLKLTYISSYIQMSIKLILVWCFGLEKLLNFYQHSSDLSSYEIIQLINLTLALTLGTLQAAYYLKRFVIAIFDYKIFFLRNSSAVINAMNYLKQTKKLPHNISFSFYPIAGIDQHGFRKQFSNKNMPLINECLNAECKLRYKLISLINTVMNQKGYNAELDYSPLRVICTRHYKKILEKQAFLVSGLDSFFSRRLNLNQIIDILNKRIQNGFVSTKLTQKLLNNFDTNEDTRNRFFYQTAVIISINTFYKLISPSMLYSSQRILYDLYGD